MFGLNNHIIRNGSCISMESTDIFPKAQVLLPLSPRLKIQYIRDDSSTTQKWPDMWSIFNCNHFN